MRRILIAALLLATAQPALAQAAPPDLVTLVAPGLASRVLIRAGDPIGDGTPFAPKNDLTAYLPNGPNAGYLVVGHEIRWGADAYGGRLTRLELRDGKVVGGQVWSSGMNNNCAGTLTPWKTVLTCEEYPHDVHPGKTSDERRADYFARRIGPDSPEAGWGWAYEVNVLGGTPAGQAQRRTGMGRYSHESAEVVGDRTVYLTEDNDPGFLYKFEADKPRDLSKGKLSAYSREKAAWLPIKDVFNAHHDAVAIGATKFVRLEDVKTGPDGALYVAETGNIPSNDAFGRIHRLDLRTNRMSVFAEGDGTHLAQPDNLVFDRQGRLLVCEDQFGENMDKHGLNEVLRREKDGTWTHLLTTPKGAEPTGPTFLPGGTTLILSVLWGAKSGVVAIDGL